MSLPPSPRRVPSGWGGQQGIEELLKPLAAWFTTHPAGHPDALNFLLVGEAGFGTEIIKQWAGKPGLESHLVPFGSTRNGSLYAFWLLEPVTIEKAPIVLLDSEGGDFSFVVARSYREFLTLLAAGLEDLDDPVSQLPSSPELVAFRNWVVTQEGIELPDAAMVIMILEQALDEVPDFTEWFEEVLS